MVVIGIDVHKRSHTAVIADSNGRQIATRTVGTTSSDHLALLQWADQHTTSNDDGSAGAQQTRLWAIEDCRAMSRRLESDLLAAGETIVRVPPKLMANARDSARTYGKSDPIDALAVARAALRYPDLPTARLDGPERQLRLLTDHREDLVAERTRAVNRLRWHLHEIDPTWDPRPRSLISTRAFTTITERLTGDERPIARIARAIAEHCRQLSTTIRALQHEIDTLTRQLAPALLAITGCAALTAAKILGETAGIHRFHSPAAYARHNGTAPQPVWSSNKTRHRLSRTGNRQLNAALHRIAVTQARIHPEAQQLLNRRKTNGDGNMQALRVLKRHLSDVVYQALHQQQPTT